MKFLTKRLFQLIFVILGLTLLMFILSRAIPGDSVRLALGPNATAEQILMMEKELGLNEPYFIQFINYLRGLFTGDMGMSLRTNRNVLLDIQETFPATLELAIVSIILSVVFGIPLGVKAATNYNKLPDFVIRIFSMSGIAIPSFLTAILLQLIFGYWLGWLPVIGRGSIVPEQITGLYLMDSVLTLNFTAFFDSLKHLILPSISLTIMSSAQIMRLTRTNMLERLNKDYILAARSYGLPTNLIENRYMLKNSFNSVLTVIGLTFGSLIGNAFLVETVFGWPGVAQYSIAGILYKDYNSIIGVTLVIGIFFAVVNIAVDFLHARIDPRIDLG